MAKRALIFRTYIRAPNLWKLPLNHLGFGVESVGGLKVFEAGSGHHWASGCIVALMVLGRRAVGYQNISGSGIKGLVEFQCSERLKG